MDADVAVTAGPVPRLLARERDRVELLCRRFDVTRLELFGSSAITEDADSSDADFIVEYRPEADLGPWMARYFEFRGELEALLGRRVDLVMRRSGCLSDERFLRQAERTRTLVYAREVAEATG